MGPKKNLSKDHTDSAAEKQFREEWIARELFQTEIQTHLPKPTKKIVDIDDENAPLSSMIDNKTLVPPENPRDPGSHLYHRILYVFGMTPKLMSVLTRMRYFAEEHIDEHINWLNEMNWLSERDCLHKNYVWSKDVWTPQAYQVDGGESVAFNESKLIQEWVDAEIKYPYTPLDVGNRKYRQTIARTIFTEGTDEKRIFSHSSG